MFNKLILWSFFAILSISVDAQNSKLIQLCGSILMSEEGGAVPFVNVVNKTHKSKTSSSILGVYSLIVNEGDTIKYSCIGFKPASFVVPATNDNFYSHNVVMKMDTYYLPETIVTNLPSKDRFNYDFVYAELDNDQYEIARQNTANNQLMFLSMVLSKDGNENTQALQKMYQQNQAYGTQSKPQQIFSPAAWMSFFESLQNGSYKKK